MTYQDTLNQFRQAQSPDPNTFLKMLWPNLDPHQQELFTTLIRRPVVSNTSQGQLKATALGEPAATAPVAPAPVNPGPPGVVGPGGLIGGLPGGVQNIGGNMVGIPGKGAPVYDPKSGGNTIPGTKLTQGITPVDSAALVKRAMAPGISVGVGNVSGLDAKGQPIVTSPATHYGGTTPAPADEIPTFQIFRQNVANDAASGRVSATQAGNPVGMGPGGIAIYGR